VGQRQRKTNRGGRECVLECGRERGRHRDKREREEDIEIRCGREREEDIALPIVASQEYSSDAHTEEYRETKFVECIQHI
jgi:hypothetical protein